MNLDVLDYHARMMDPALGRFWTPDILSHTMPSWSGYSYGLNNPIRFTDPTGNGVEGDYYNSKGQLIGNDGKVDNKIYLVKDGVSSKDLGLGTDPITGSLFSKKHP